MKSTVMAALLAAASTSALAHVTLEQKEAEAGTAYKAVFKVGHGCEGGAATRQLVVTVPAGLRGAKPTPKAGWTLSRKGDEISWTAKTAEDQLQDDWVDEFLLRGTLAEQPGALWFKVRQVCVGAESNWSEVPADGGTETRGLKWPAARLLVLPKAAGAAEPHHH